MSQSPPNYMENVPVKISERYKPPPKVSLPQSVCQRLNADNVPCLNLLAYDFSLENNVLRRIDEWKRMREAERDARRERMHKRESERQLIEEEQKKLLTAVSYPSTAELSSDDDELEDGELNRTPPELGPVSSEASGATTVATSVQVQYTASQHRFDTILTPTIVPGAHSLGGYNNQMPKQSLSKINYSDFENDTSSPFDNVELKTINDLDILAQVLNITQLHSSTSSIASDQNHDDSLSPPPTGERQADLSADNANIDQFSQSSDVYPQNSENSENCNLPTAGNVVVGGAKGFKDSVTPNVYVTSPSSCLQNANHFYPTYSTSPTMHNNANMNGVAKLPNCYYYPQPLPQLLAYDNYMYSNINYPLNLIQSNHNSSSVMMGATTPAAMTTTLPKAAPAVVAASKNVVSFRDIEMTPRECEDSTASSATIKNKSKSVPDILRELNDEIRDSENRRIRNNSQSIENYENKLNDQVAVTKNKPASGAFMKLSPSSQLLAKNISSMGFPLELVSRIAERMGNDDKKIVEHLIPLSELLDLGFDETRISDALLKFDNNKEKALDFLIS